MAPIPVGGRRKGGPFLFYLLLVLGLAALGLAIYAYFRGSEHVIPWQPVADLYPITTTLATFSDLFQTFKIPVTAFVVSERFDVGLPVVTLWPAGVYLGILGVALAAYFTIISTLARLPFVIAMTLVMLFLATFNVDLLRAAHQNSQWLLILVLGVLVLLSFAFQAFFTGASRAGRFAVFSGALLALAVFIASQSQYSAALSAMQVVHYSSLGGFVAAGLFIFLVAFENIHALLWLNTQGPSRERRFGLIHFAVIGLLYLLNLLLLYLKNAAIISIDFYFVDAFILLLLSAGVGFWGWQRREVHYQSYLTFRDGAAYLYLILAILCFLSIGYAFATANTPLISAYTDVIVYTHLAYGFMFFLYVLLNFWNLIREKLAVYKVVFDPKQIPFFTVYVMGTLLLMSLVFRSSFSVYNRAQAGYYNYLGDFYKAAADPLLAERFYVEGTVFSHHNLKSTYALAGIYRERTHRRAEINMLRDALAGPPSEKVYLRLAATQTDQKDFFNHLFLLNQGLRTFPNSAALFNNKALLYETTALADSTEYFYQRALPEAGNFRTLVQSNRLAFNLKSNSAAPAQALARQTPPEPQHPAWQSNMALLTLLHGQPGQPPMLPAQPAESATLMPAQFALFYHQTLQSRKQPKPGTIPQINRYLRDSANAPYAENLTLLKGLAQFHAGQVNEARNTLENQALVSAGAAGFYYYIIGSWLLEQRLYEAAASYFEKARNANTPAAELPYLYALAHTAQKDAARSAIAAADFPEPADQKKAAFLAGVLNLTTASVLTASDSAKIAYLMIYHPELTTPEAEAVANAVQTNNFKLLAQRELARHYLRVDQLAAADRTLAAALTAAQKDKNLTTELQLLQADLLARQGNLTGLRNLLPALANNPTTQDQLLFYRALVAETGPRQQADRLYQNIPQTLIYREDALLAAARYFSRVKKNDDQAYAILLSGIKYNPFSVRLYEAYIFASIRLGLLDFAQTAAAELKDLLPPAQYAIFRSTYEQRLQEKQSSFPSWD